MLSFAKDNYVLVLTLTAVFDETEETKTVETDPTVTSYISHGPNINEANKTRTVEVTYTETKVTTTTVTKNSTVTWKVSSIEEKRPES